MNGKKKVRCVFFLSLLLLLFFVFTLFSSSLFEPTCKRGTTDSHSIIWQVIALSLNAQRILFSAFRWNFLAFFFHSVENCSVFWVRIFLSSSFYSLSVVSYTPVMWNRQLIYLLSTKSYLIFVCIVLKMFIFVFMLFGYNNIIERNKKKINKSKRGRGKQRKKKKKSGETINVRCTFRMPHFPNGMMKTRLRVDILIMPNHQNIYIKKAKKLKRISILFIFLFSIFLSAI